MQGNKVFEKNSDSDKNNKGFIGYHSKRKAKIELNSLKNENNVIG